MRNYGHEKNLGQNIFNFFQSALWLLIVFHLYPQGTGWPISAPMSLQWRHNGRDSVLSHQPHEFTQPFIQTQIKENIKAPLTGVCAGNSPVTAGFSARTRKMFSFDDAIMIYGTGIWMHDSFTSRILWTIGTSGRFCLSHQMSDINNSLKSTIIRSIELESVFPFHEKYRIDNVYNYVSIRFTMVVI